LFVAEPVITTFSCSILSPQRRLNPQYVGCSTANHSDNDNDNDNDYSTDDANYVDDIDDILSSDLASCCPAPSPYDSNADSCDGNDSDGGGGHTSPQWTMSPDLPSDDDVDYVDDVVTSQPSPTG